MILVSHRGNISGRDPTKENSVDYILAAIDLGFDVEIDVWYDLNKKQYFLGHNEPIYEISSDFSLTDGLWCHAKNKTALEKLLELDVNCFWHQNDKFTLTSRGFVWCYPDNWSEKGITVVFDSPNTAVLSKNIMGICVDDPLEWRKLL